MLEQALVAYLHYVAVFLTAATLAAEFFLYRPPLSARIAKTLPRIDLVYGIAAIAAVATGFARALWFGKSWEFYRHSGLFWLKVSLVATWGILSILPTIHFLRVAKVTPEGGHVSIEPGLAKRIRVLLWAQVLIVPWVPLVAVLMSRGLG